MKNIAASAVLILCIMGCGSDGTTGGTDVSTGGDCIPQAPAKVVYGSGDPGQVTIIYDPGTHEVTVHEGYKSPDTIVVDKNGDGTYLVTTGSDWTVTDVSHGTIVDHQTWFEWKDAPADTKLSVTMHDAGNNVVTIDFKYDADGVEIVDACW